MAKDDKRKKGSVKKRRRKGFHGVRPQEKANKSRNDAATMDANPSTSSALRDIPVPCATPVLLLKIFHLRSC